MIIGLCQSNVMLMTFKLGDEFNEGKMAAPKT